MYHVGLEVMRKQEGGGGGGGMLGGACRVGARVAARGRQVV